MSGESSGERPSARAAHAQRSSALRADELGRELANSKGRREATIELLVRAGSLAALATGAPVTCRRVALASTSRGPAQLATLLDLLGVFE